ncbi:spindle pole body component [Scheffersomyces stipitis CBS 6054]|uniref:Spindle pole body component n=1 Tax=Scheffersomyces stipitis (strain ATCC 58785 / CBS 6054 / NBRC 10063 / NRRL Y-11545) TaxID=322104 RepID=A3LV76_PICST|nr:spindle pole body component [Scheffersomyces stipitis CBS 6054]ABN67077.2 spindle pole body component [Scheffersomyces stipitis CBS 6054]
MALDRNQLIRVYSSRLVKSLVPAEFGEEFIHSVTNDLLTSFNNNLSQPTTHSQNEINSITNKFKTSFLSHGAKSQWVSFQRVLESLLRFKSVDQVCNYLIFLDALQNPESQTFGNPNRDNINAKNWISQETLSQIIEPYYETLSEESILAYLSFTLLGLDSKLLSFSNNKEIEIPATVNRSYSGLLTNILECALLYKNLQIFIESKMGKMSSPIKTAYLRVLELQINSYVTHINDLFTVQPSSLIAVYNSIYPWIPKLRFLYSLTLDQDTLNGFDFLTKVYGLTKFGDVVIRELSEVIFYDISKPYFEILENWIISGDLIDNSDDFFIKFNPEKNYINDIIDFIPTKIPTFISKRSGYKIFQIGKTLIFLAKYCKELNWLNQYTHKYTTEIFSVNGGLQSMSINDVTEVVNNQYYDVMNYLTTVLQGPKNELYTHLVNFKKIYFTDSNDFIDVLISKGTRIFEESSTNISSTYLSQVITEAVNYSSMQHFRYKNRVDARVLNPTHGNVGWEVFTVEYRIEDLAINYLLEPQMSQYLKMFHFVWKIKHLQFVLNNNFVDATNLKKNDLKSILQKYRKIQRKIVWVTKAFNTSNLIRAHMQKFLNSLIGYISYDIIENNFNSIINRSYFKTNIAEEKFDNVESKSLLSSLNPDVNEDHVDHNVNELTIDEIIKKHEDYLRAITNFKLLSEDSLGKLTQSSYISQIYEILHIIFKFVTSCREFHHLIVNYVLVLNLEENEDSLEDDTMVQIDNDLEEIERTLVAVVDRIYKDIYSSEFKLREREFVQDLKIDFELRDLSRLF